MPAPPTPPRSAFRLRGAWAGGLIVAAAFLTYVNSWTAAFVYDDTLAIPQNPTIRHLWPLSRVLLPPVEGGLTVSGRPVLNLSLAFNYALSGPDPWSYHVVNTLIHAGAGLLLFGIVRRTMRRLPDVRSGGNRASPPADPLALTIAVLWTVHPLQTQAVTYTVQRAESLMGFFYFLTLYAFIRASQCHLISDKHRKVGAWQAASVLACALGMGTKEVMATAPLLVLLYDRTFAAGSFAAAWRRRRPYYLALAATWLLLAALVLSTGGNRGGTIGFGTGIPPWAYPLTQFKAVACYLALSVWPDPLVFEYGTGWARRAGDVLPYAAVVGPLLAATVVALRRWPVAGFLGAWFFVILAPTSLAPGTIQMIVEHRMYLPLAAVITGLAWGLHRAAGRRVLLAGAILAIGCAALTVRRNQDYRSPLTLWADTVAKRPLNPRAHDGLAEALTAAGRHAEAIAERREILRLGPDDAQLHYSLALALAAAGRTDEARQEYEEALARQPDHPRSHNNLAILLAATGRNAEALSHYAEAVRLAPAEPLYHYNLGTALMRAGRLTEAVASYEAALRLHSDHPEAHLNLASVLMRLQRQPEALEHYRKALHSQPDDPDHATTYGNALLAANLPADALIQFRNVLATRPGAVAAHYGAGNALAALHRPAEAVVEYEAVLRQSPQHAGAQFKLGNALLDLDNVSAAISHYQTALRLSPQNAETRHNLGIALARLERWDEARLAFDEALRLKPDYADAQRSRAQLRQVTGR